jgi:hypothetical protein
MVVRFDHEDEADGDEGSNDRHHEKKDLPPNGLVQVTVMRRNDHAFRMRAEGKKGFEVAWRTWSLLGGWRPGGPALGAGRRGADDEERRDCRDDDDQDHDEHAGSGVAGTVLRIGFDWFHTDLDARLGQSMRGTRIKEKAKLSQELGFLLNLSVSR